MDQWVNKLWDIHKIEYQSIMKRNEVLMHATKYMNLRNIILSVRSQTQKGLYDSISRKYSE